MSKRHSQTALTLAALLALSSRGALAQTWPVAPTGANLRPWRGASVAPLPAAPPGEAPGLRRVTEEDRDELDRALMDIVSGRAVLAATRLSERVIARGGDLHGYDADAVLWRVAAQEMPRPRRAAGDAAGLPAPPGEREAMERSIDGAVELLARRDARSAAEWIDAAMRARPALPSYHPLRVLGRLARSLVDASAAPPLARRPTEASGPRHDRPRATIDGGEAVVLYQLGAVYGLTLGAWTAVGIRGASDASSAINVVAPVLGAGAGMVVAALVDARRDMRRGRVYAANAGFYLGLIGALGVRLLPDGPLADASSFGSASAFLGAGTAGIGLGIAVAHAADSMPGSASFVLSGGAWGALLGLSLDRAFRDGPTGDGAVGLLAGEAIGVGATLLTAGLLRPTPAQTRWLDLGALLGGLAGALLFSTTDNTQTASLASAIGCVGGGALGFVLGAPSDAERELSRRLEARAPSFTPTFTPMRGGGVIGLAL